MSLGATLGCMIGFSLSGRLSNVSLHRPWMGRLVSGKSGLIVAALGLAACAAEAPNAGAPTGSAPTPSETASASSMAGADTNGAVGAPAATGPNTAGTSGQPTAATALPAGSTGGQGSAAPVPTGAVTTGPDATGPGAGSGGASNAVPADPGVWINAGAAVSRDSNTFGIGGDWYAFGDGVTSTQSGNPYRDGMYCITGEAPGDGDSAHWGAGIGLDLNGMNGEKLPYEFAGKLSGFRIRFVGTIPDSGRLHFVSNLDSEVTPYIPIRLDESFVYSIADARVPLEWAVENAGERVTDGVLYALQALVPGDQAAGPIDLCIAEFEAIFDPNATGSATEGGTTINTDGYILAEENEFGITGPVYAIGDGVSTTQEGNPYRDGKYCVAGEFSGAADHWGAGIAFDLNKAPGSSERLAFAPGDVAGFRVGLSGSSPGAARIQFIVHEPQVGDQPFLVASLNSTQVYPMAWAQVPTSWDVDNSGIAVSDALYSVQLYLEGTVPGAFDVCVEEFTPLTAAEVTFSAQPPAAGYSGSRTVEADSLQAEYERWKQRHFVDCGDGSACIPRDEGDCISEGVAYGMLLTAGFDDQAAFDQLWAYFEKHKNANGVMNWQTDQCGSATSEGSATDGELDAAMALIQAACKWGGTYQADALELIQAIQTSEVTTCDNQTVLKPGDNFGGCDRLNPSYFAPGYFKVFEALTGDATWTALTNDGYALLADVQSNHGGLVPDWSDSRAAVPSGSEGEYGPDASRTPWRIATDYAWFAEPRAATFLSAVSDYVDNNGGIQRLFTPNSNFRGGLAMSGLPQDGAKAQEYTHAWLTTAVDDSTYFPGTLRPLYLLLMAQQFPSGCN